MKTIIVREKDFRRSNEYPEYCTDIWGDLIELLDLPQNTKEIDLKVEAKTHH